MSTSHRRREGEASGMPRSPAGGSPGGRCQRARVALARDPARSGACPTGRHDVRRTLAEHLRKPLRPIGAQIRRTGITANHLTLTGLAMATAASLTIAQGLAPGRVGLLVLTAIPDVLDGAVAKASGTASPRGRSSTR